MNKQVRPFDVYLKTLACLNEQEEREKKQNASPTEEQLELSNSIPYGDNSPLYHYYDEEGQPLWKQSPDEYFDFDYYYELLREFGLEKE